MNKNEIFTLQIPPNNQNELPILVHLSLKCCVRFDTDFLIFSGWFFLIFVFLQLKFHFDDIWWLYAFDFFVDLFWCCFIDFTMH